MAELKISEFGAKLAYAIVFVIIIPCFLVLWAMASSSAVPLPVPPFPWTGAVVMVLGTAMALFGMRALWVHGRGLPMNPFPPEVFVTKGMYSLTPHPIYVGFSLACFGASVAAGSPSGLWMVSPCVALACAALVLGYERDAIRRQFGEPAYTPYFALPADTMDPPDLRDILSVMILVYLPWLITFEAVYFLGVPPDAVIAFLPFEHAWPVWEWTEAFYGSAYLFAFVTLVIAPSKAVLRRFAILGLVATAVVIVIYLLVPLIAPPKPFEAQTMWGHLLNFEREMANVVAAFPSFHVIWVLLMADVWASRSARGAAIGWGWAILITISCITTGMHAIVDIAAAVIFYLWLRNLGRFWHWLRRMSEKVANSWSEWRIGPLRIINYGAYAGLGGVVSLIITVGLSGPSAFWQLLVIHLAAVLGAMLWAQTLEGSSALSRPFGYYGSVLGAAAATVLVGAMGDNILALGAVIAVVAPWVQLIGRMRCLVQGCCHGSQCSDERGIRYWQEKSRVCGIGNLRGVPVYPTPLYSMLSNLVIGLVLFRLWSLGAHYSLIAGAYLILSGLSRFVEESYRGEPQTWVVGGLKIYQWMAILSLLMGALITMIPSTGPQDLTFWMDWRVAVTAVLFGIMTAFAMGADFPESSRRFARLAPP